MGRASLLGGPPTPFVKRRFGPAPLGLRFGPMYMSSLPYQAKYIVGINPSSMQFKSTPESIKTMEVD